MTQATPSVEVEYLSPRAGFAILCAMVLFVAGWLGTRGKEAILATADTPPPALQVSTDLDRFAADAWYLPNDSMLGFVSIAEGQFVMGSDPRVDRFAFANERWSADEFQGAINLPEFLIGRYEVTVAQFHAFATATHYKVDAQALQAGATHPVSSVAWTDALAYAEWLEKSMRESSRTPVGLKGLLAAGWHISLPTEAQWEKAARGNDDRIYPWGNSPMREYANFDGPNTTPVGSRKCVGCAYDLADMSGNVWELTRTPLDAYPYRESPRLESGSEALFVMRGGSFNDNASGIRAALRGGVDPGARRPFIGFRLVISKTAPLP